MSTLDAAGLIEAVSRIARVAGHAIMEVYATDFAVGLKSDASPVTEADMQSERIIAAALRDLTPDTPVVSEEQASPGDRMQTPWSQFWLVDPLDGTREFLNRNGEFTVNIALIEDGEPILGVVHVPVDDTTYAGARGVGAHRRRRDAAPESIAARPAPMRGAVVVHSRSHADESAIAAYAADLAGATLRAAGSSVKFCLLAAGEADFYPRFGRTMEWDTAAGHAVLAAAGGSVRTRDGHPLRYCKPGFSNPHFIAQGSASPPHVAA